MDQQYVSFLAKVDKELEQVCTEFLAEGDTELRDMFYYAALSGRKYRPSLVLTGKLIGDKNYNRTTIQLAIAIELIHKYSLILDDSVDNDPLRRGKETFYQKYGKDNAFAMSSYFMGLIFKKINYIRDIYSTDVRMKSVLMLFEEILSDMSVGFISDLNKKSRDIRGVRRISNMQTSTLLRNSLLIGFISSDYYSISECAFLYKNLCELGDHIGTVFQAYNDIEVFCGNKFQMANKGKLFSDFFDNRKNILLSKIPPRIIMKRDTNELVDYINRNKLFEEVFNEIFDVLNEMEAILKTLPKDQLGTKFLSAFLASKKQVIRALAKEDIFNYNNVNNVSAM